MNYKAWGRSKPGVMNRLEKKYSEYLEEQKHKGEVLWWMYEPFNLRLAAKTYYRPDFLVLPKDMVLTAVECKGFWLDKARVKIKVAADLFPFKFIGVKLDRRLGWVVEEF